MSNTNSSKALIVDDDATLRRVLKDNFEFAGYEVRVAENGKAGWEAVQCFRPNLIVLDVMMPHINGFDLCRRIRSEEITSPIIMLTAKGQESDMVLGLNLGADDYVVKPFSVDVLLARASACLRRVASRKSTALEPIEFGECRLDLESHKLFRAGEEVELSPKESGLLRFFIENEGRALTRDQILDAVWGEDLIVTQRSVDRCVNTLRGKVESDPQRPQCVRTIRDVGYRFERG